jgi:hypothetical protein
MIMIGVNGAFSKSSSAEKTPAIAKPKIGGTLDLFDLRA